MPRRTELPHINFSNFVTTDGYVSPNQAPRPRYPERTRAQHARHLLNQIRNATSEALAHREQVIGAPSPEGIFLEFESAPNFELTIKSLDLPSKGIELLSVKDEKRNEGAANEETINLATVFVPDSQIAKFVKTIEDYRDSDTATGKPKNSALVTSISNIRQAVLRSLWTDSLDVFPGNDEVIWWEVWLRATPDSVPRFQNYASGKDLLFSRQTLIFPDRHVVLVYATSDQLKDCIDVIDSVAELRRAKECLNDFLDMNHREQVTWAEALDGLMTPSGDENQFVCILDTGVNRLHPLLTNYLNANHVLACNSTWSTRDLIGHGTAMAGLALLGDVESALVSTNRVPVYTKLESVKILHRDEENAPELYGAITKEAVKRALDANPEGRRVLLMAVSATDYRDRGQPSSWSAAVDEICFGKEDGNKYLFLLSAGNVSRNDFVNYPDSNALTQVKDPGQSWNALTVGAITNKVTIREEDFRNWHPLAPAGDLAPASSTSSMWPKKWPLKPEVVFEGGNAAKDAQNTVDTPDSLGVLSTYHSTEARLYTSFGDTSAASAQLGYMASKISSLYPEYWPETVRGLIVHSAEWNERIKNHYPCANKTERERLLKVFGYGIPNLEKALSSANNILTLISQQELKPFEKNRMKDMHLYELPWPIETLQELGATNVKMRVTLSYFIEPNPARRGWSHKFRYQSHGLRFDVKTPEENVQQFKTRLNREYWDNDDRAGNVTTNADTADWYFGRSSRTKGSIHSDIWEGSAASLASRGVIAVMPVVGWWREKYAEGHTDKKARYSLIVTIETADVNIDLYTPVETLITPVEITIEDLV